MRNCVAEPAIEQASILAGEYRIERVDDMSLTSIATRTQHTPALKQALNDQGFELPFVESIAGDARQGLFWMAPNQYMLYRPYVDGPQTLALPAGVFQTEQTDGWARLDVQGPNLAALMERLVNLDTDRLQPGFATRSVLHHVGVFVCVFEGSIGILCPRSMAGSVAHAIEQAGRTLRALA